MSAALEQSGSDPHAALAVYQRILEIAPDDVETLKRLGAACSALEQWEEVAKVGARLAQKCTGEEAREYRMRRAHVLADRLGRKEEAAEAFLAMLAEDPKPAVLTALEKIAAGGVLAKKIAEATLPVYLKSADHVRAAQALQTLVAGTDDLTHRLALMHQHASILEDKLADRRGAFSVMEQALRLQPGDAKVRAELERLAKDLSAHAELAALLMEIADRLSDPAVQLELMLRAAALAEAGGDAELAIQALDLALALPGGRAEAPRALQRVAVRAERWADAERALKARLQDEAEKAPLLVDLAKVCDRQGRPADAAAALEQGLAAGASAVDLLPHLSRLYEAAKDLRGLESSLSRELALAEKAADKEKTARLRLRVSKLQERSGGDRSKAVANYAAVLAERPSDPEALGALEKMLQNPELREVAAKALVPAYEATKEFRKLVFALEVLAEAATEAGEKVAVLKRIAQVHAVDLRHPPLAFATLARALRITPADAQLRVATRKAAEDADSLDAYAEILAESASASQGASAIPLFRELAEVSERKLGNREQAIAYLVRILEIDAENIDGLRGLHRLYRLSESWQDLAVVCRRLAKVIFDEHERSALYREAGTLFEGTLKRPDEAAECFRALSESDPLDRDSALALDRLYTGLQRPQDLAFALELRRSQEAGTPAGREAAFRLAELKRNVLNDPAGALQLFGAVLAEDPNHANARATLEAWAKSGGQGSAEATKLIDPALERAGEHARRVALREAALAQATPAEKARLWAEIRKINELDMGRPELAFMAACRAFTEDVDREHVGPELERLARATDSWEELSEVYEQVAENSMPGDEVGLYCLRRAAQLRAHLGESEKAIGLWKNLLQEVPGDREALEALAKLHERSQNARELSEVYKQQAALAQDPVQRASLLLQAGAAKAQAGDDAAAIELGRAALVLNPKSRGALELLDKAYERAKKDHERADVLRLLADLTEDIVARRATLMRRAQLLEDQGELAEAVEAYARVLNENAGEAAAVAGLERLFQKEQARAMVARVLEPFYRSINDGRHLADVLEVRAAQSAKEERQVVLFEIARLRESLGQRPLAFAAMLRCFRDDPHDASIRDEMERLAAETGSFEELAAAYEDELEHEKDEAVQLEMWRRLGALYGDRLGQPDRAAQAWEEVYRRAPDDTGVLDTLSRIYRRTSSLRELVAVLWRQVAMEQDGVKRREHLVEIASLCEEKLGDRDTACAAWKEIRRLKEDDSQALTALQRLLAECNRYEELSELLSWLADQAVAQDKIEESLELKVALGKLKLNKLSEPREALALFQEVVAKRPGHAGAVAAMEQMARGEGGLKADAAMALEPVFAQGGDYLKLVQMLEARAQAAAPVEKSSLLRRIAELYAGPLDSVEMAYVWAARALETLPDEPESLAAVLRYAKPAGAEEECASLLSEEVEKARSDEARIALQRALAQLLATQPAERDQAVLAFRRLLELSPGDPEALDGLAAFYRDGGQWADLLEVLRRQLAAAPDGAARAELMRRIGELQDEKVGDKTGAIATFRRLLEIVPDDVHAIERLDQLCQAEERWAELADVLNKEIAAAEKQGKREQTLTLKFRLAQVREQRLLDRSGAMTLYREVLQMRPGHVETIARLEVVFSKEPTYDEAADLLADAYRTVNNHGKLAKLLEDRAAAGIDQSARKKHLGELAKIRGQHQERPDLAFIALCKAFREDPSDAATRQALEVTADQAETHEELAGLYEEELPRLDGKDAAEVCLKLAQLSRPEAQRERAGHQLLREGPRLRPVGLPRGAAGPRPPVQGGRGLGQALGDPLVAGRAHRRRGRPDRAALPPGPAGRGEARPAVARPGGPRLRADPRHRPGAPAGGPLARAAVRDRQALRPAVPDPGAAAEARHRPGEGADHRAHGRGGGQRAQGHRARHRALQRRPGAQPALRGGLPGARGPVRGQQQPRHPGRAASAPAVHHRRPPRDHPALRQGRPRARLARPRPGGHRRLPRRARARPAPQEVARVPADHLREVRALRGPGHRPAPPHPAGGRRRRRQEGAPQARRGVGGDGPPRRGHRGRAPRAGRRAAQGRGPAARRGAVPHPEGLRRPGARDGAAGPAGRGGRGHPPGHLHPLLGGRGLHERAQEARVGRARVRAAAGDRPRRAPGLRRAARDLLRPGRLAPLRQCLRALHPRRADAGGARRDPQGSGQRPGSEAGPQGPGVPVVLPRAAGRPGRRAGAAGRHAPGRGDRELGGAGDRLRGPGREGGEGPARREAVPGAGRRPRQAPRPGRRGRGGAAQGAGVRPCQPRRARRPGADVLAPRQGHRVRRQPRAEVRGSGLHRGAQGGPQGDRAHLPAAAAEGRRGRRGVPALARARARPRDVPHPHRPVPGREEVDPGDRPADPRARLRERPRRPRPAAGRGLGPLRAGDWRRRGRGLRLCAGPGVRPGQPRGTQCARAALHQAGPRRRAARRLRRPAAHRRHARAGENPLQDQRDLGGQVPQPRERRRVPRGGAGRRPRQSAGHQGPGAAAPRRRRGQAPGHRAVGGPASRLRAAPVARPRRQRAGRAPGAGRRGLLPRAQAHRPRRADLQPGVGDQPAQPRGDARPGHPLRAQRQLAVRPGHARQGSRAAGRRQAGGGAVPPHRQDQRGDAARPRRRQGRLPQRLVARRRVPAQPAVPQGHLRVREGLGQLPAGHHPGGRAHHRRRGARRGLAGGRALLPGLQGRP
ncbi:MAG: hypothetical protein QM765_14920 [Myxococcales bacterium]